MSLRDCRRRPAGFSTELPLELLEPEAEGVSTDDTLDLELHERTLIRRALDRFHGNRRRAAQALRISTVRLWRKMTRYNLTGDVSDDSATNFSVRCR